jgi:alkanesulfonate monooxygenase SsuD/methylene tetrahydromethanopterin reductase-like flavin-dependent oxidoreductase (luciferase family)
MQVIWRDDNAAYHGEFVDFDPIWSWPKPVQKPHPPIYLGGHGPKALDRVVRYCDGWMPIPLRAGDLRAAIADLHRRARAAGRDPARLTISLYGVPGDAEQLRAYADLGVHRAIFAVPSAPREQVLPLLDHYVQTMASLR